MFLSIKFSLDKFKQYLVILFLFFVGGVFFSVFVLILYYLFSKFSFLNFEITS